MGEGGGDWGGDGGCQERGGPQKSSKKGSGRSQDGGIGRMGPWRGRVWLRGAPGVTCK